MPTKHLPPPPPERRAERTLRGVPVTTTLSTLAVAYNGWQLAGLATLAPFSSKAYRRWARLGYGAWIRFAMGLYRQLNGLDAVITGDPLPGGNCLVIANHQGMADIFAVMWIARKAGRHGDLKWFAKDSLKWVPGPGWGLAAIDTLFVKRDWAKDRATIDQVFRKLREDDAPLWVVSYPEGTRQTPEKLDSARAFARDRGWSEPRHVLLPRPRGFAATLYALGTRLDAVLDLTLGYPDGVPTLHQVSSGQFTRFHIHARVFPLSTLPTEEEALAVWLRECFEDKDDLLERFYATGSFQL